MFHGRLHWAVMMPKPALHAAQFHSGYSRIQDRPKKLASMRAIRLEAVSDILGIITYYHNRLYSLLGDCR
jgi:hypothetical protein